MLHLVSSKNNTQQALGFMADGDAILFMESSTLHLLNSSVFIKGLRECAVKVKFYTLISDIQLRGIVCDEVSELINIVDYTGFVDLTVAHNTIKTWN